MFELLLNGFGAVFSLNILVLVTLGVAVGIIFGAVTVGAIADALNEATGANVDKRRIDVGQPIKALGAHQVTVRVHPEVTAQVRLNVVASK